MIIDNRNKDTFYFINDCLDSSTIKYLFRGITPAINGVEDLNEESLASLLKMPLAGSSIKDLSFNATLISALNPYLKNLTNPITKPFRFRKSTKNKEERVDETNIHTIIKKILKNFINYISRSRDRVLADMAHWLDSFPQQDYLEIYVYLGLYLVEEDYPDWLLVPSFDQIQTDEELSSSSKTISFDEKKLREAWRKFVNKSLNDSKLENDFLRVFFSVCVLVILKSETEKLRLTGKIEFPITLPDIQSSKYLEEKIFWGHYHSNKDRAALLLGVYIALGKNDPLIESSLEEQVRGYSIGEVTIQAIKPIEFTEWQAKLLVETKALNPLFSILSALRYMDSHLSCDYPTLYYEFQPYEVRKEGLKKLLVDHFFPFNHLNSDYTVKKLGYKDELTEGPDKGKIVYIPPVKEGINLELIDKIYLSFNYLPIDMMKDEEELEPHSYDVIQVDDVTNVENGEIDIARRYAFFLSNKGFWSVVRNSFDCKVDRDVAEILSNLRHNIGHSLGPIHMSLEKIIEYVEKQEHCKEQQRVLDYSRDTLISIKEVAAQLTVTSKRIAVEAYSEKLNFLSTLDGIIQTLQCLDDTSIKYDIPIKFVNKNVPEDLNFLFWGEDAAWFKVMMQNIIYNAKEHGFASLDDFELPQNPQIMIQSSLYDNTLSLSIMNNGRKSNIKLEEYRARGICEVKNKNNMGLGGAQIDEIVRRHGGTLSLRASDEWNFILTIDFKLEYK